MGTSLMNDSAYAYDISRNLIEMGQVLFTPRDSEEASTEREVALGDSELDDLLNESDDQNK